MSELLFKNRIDAELYQPKLLKSYDEIQKLPWESKKLSQCCLIKSGTTPIDRNDDEKEGAILFKTTDIRNNILLPSDDLYRISEDIHKRMRKTRLEKEDVLLNIVGASLSVIGRSSFVNSVLDDNEANITQAMALLRNKTSDILAGYLFAYLNTVYAQDQIKRYARPTGQYNLNLFEVGEILIPIIPRELQEQVAKLVLDSERKMNKSQNLYVQAEELLNQQLKLDQVGGPKKTYSETSFLNVLNSHRLDAQHFQDKFTDLIDHLSNFSPKKVKDIALFNRRGVQPNYISDGQIDVVNSQHIGKKHLKYDFLEKTSKEIFLKSPEGHIRMNDLLIYTTGAYIGRTNVFLGKNPALASNHVNILRINPEFDSAYVGMILQSKIGKLQTEMHLRGSAQAELYSSDIEKFIIPMLSPNIQKNIGDLVRESKRIESESKQLINDANGLVESIITKQLDKQSNLQKDLEYNKG